MNVLSKSVKTVFNKYPIVRGMVSYGVSWPISSFIQQTFEGKRFNSENGYDWWRCVRFGLYGSCYVAPTLYSWLTIASIAWPGTTLSAGLAKTFFETISYTPFAMCSFYFFMSFLETHAFDLAAAEVSAKFWPTYKVGASVWPAVALVNYTLIPAKNRVPFISVCSLIWTCFLAHMKQLEKDEEKIAELVHSFIVTQCAKFEDYQLCYMDKHGEMAVKGRITAEPVGNQKQKSYSGRGSIGRSLTKSRNECHSIAGTRRMRLAGDQSRKYKSGKKWADTYLPAN